MDLLIFLLLFNIPVFALERQNCINGSYDKNREFIASVESSTDPLRLAYLKNKKETSARAPAAPVCMETDISKKQLSSLGNVAESAKKPASSPGQTPALIKRECIAASLKRRPGNEGHICKDQKIKMSYNTADSSNQCFTEDTLDYIHFAVNSAIQCMSPVEDPIDSRMIFTKFNNETAFNPSIAWKGGAGLGQLTTPAINEIIEGKGRYIIESIANSEKPECEGFRNVAKSDLQKSPSFRLKNSCPWISPGDGLARNLIYSIGYYLTMRDQYIRPAVEDKSPVLLKFKKLIGSLTAISYSSEGMEGARWSIDRIRVNRKTDPVKVEAQVNKNSKYLGEVKDKMKEMTCLKKSLEPSSKECKKYELTKQELEADTCVSY
ncbi:MAG: hypothetical protein ACXVB1_09530 [Pseudobdellovibrionaceae bacterium]